MFCTKCGAEMQDDAKICASCGNEVEEQEEMRNEATEEPALNLEKPKNNNKAAFIIIGVIGVAILAAVVYLVVSLVGVGNPHTNVKKAFINTMADFAEKDEYTKFYETIVESGLVCEESNMEITDFNLNVDGEEITLPDYCEPIRFGITGTSDLENIQGYSAISLGIGDMNDITFDMYLDKDEYLIGVPELYPNYFMIDMAALMEEAEMEYDWEELYDTKKAQEAMLALGNTFKTWAAEMYEDVVCEKNDNAVLNTGDREIEAQEYYLYMPVDAYEKHWNALPAKIEATTEFMDYYTSMTSEEDAKELIEVIYEAVEEGEQEPGITHVELAYVYVSDKKVVQISMPLDEEEDDMEGGLTVSFFGKENVSDDFRVELDAKDDIDDIKISLSMLNREDANMYMYWNGNDLLDMKIDGEYEVSDGKAHYNIKSGSLSMEMADEFSTVAFEAKFSGTSTISKAETISMPDKSSAKNLMELSDEEVSEFITTFLKNMSEKGCVPSQLKEDFDMLTASLPYMMDDMDFGFDGDDIDSGDDGAGALDGSENLTYDEFAAMVKEIYGDIYSEEELKQLYDALYTTGAYEESGDVSDYDTSGVVYGSSGIPYLFSYEDDLTIEIQPVDGFVFGEEYSDAYLLEYEKAVGEYDMIIMDYSITSETQEEYLAWEADFNKEYYIEYGYKQFDISETKYDVINGHSVAWFEYSAVYDETEKATGIVAYAKIDDTHGCTLDLYSFYGTEELSEELLYKCFDFELIEN